MDLGEEASPKVDCEPTYEELKPAPQAPRSQFMNDCEPTYEELKLLRGSSAGIIEANCEPTYEELKL